MAPEWIWIVFVFLFGGCVGSFLNVVIYRLPREKSLVYPPSACPKCGKGIHFYDNIPMLSWLILGGKCRNCKNPISPRYFVVELVTAMLFVGVFVMYFIFPIRVIFPDLEGIQAFLSGGWLFYIVSIVLLAAFLAASAIDMELWVIPLSICWFVTAAGLICSGVGPLVISAETIRVYRIFPVASALTGALCVGALIGLIIALAGLFTGIIKRSYPFDDEDSDIEDVKKEIQSKEDEHEYNHRHEMLKEVVFLAPVIIGAVAAFGVFKYIKPVNDFWIDFSQKPVVSGLLGSLWGYFIGCITVWTTRILGTLLFGKEAMGLGDVHLMGAAGAVTGPLMVVVAFFIAPFFGLLWAVFQMFFRKTRQIPYGPFLSLGVFVVMIFHDRLWEYFSNLYVYR